MDLIKICVSDDFEVDYDRSDGTYRVGVFKDGHLWDEYWFDAYEDKEIERMYLVYGTNDDDEHLVEAMFDNREQALACAEWLNLTEKNSGWNYYAGNGSWSLNKLDYVEKLKQLKDKSEEV